MLAHARAGDIDDVIATIDRFAYEKSMLINVGDEKGALLDAAVRRAEPKLALELGTYCGYGALRIARAAPGAQVYSVELAEANAVNARQIWAHAGVADRITCVVGTIGDGGRTLDALAADHGFASGALDFVFLDHDKDAYLVDLLSILDRGWLHTGSIVVADNVRVPGAPEVSPIHAPAAGHALEHRRTQGARGVPEPDLGSGAGVGVPGRLARPRVSFGPDFAQRVHGDHRVDLRGGHRRVSQEFLHDADIGSAFEKMRRERMPQRVR